MPTRPIHRLGASAIHEAIDLLAVLRKIAREQERRSPTNSEFDPSWTTITVGEIGGGTAPEHPRAECRFVFDVRTVPGVNPDAMLAPFFAEVARVNEKLAKLGPGCGVVVDLRADAPPLQLQRDSAAETFMRALTGDNQIRVAAFATEAGQFQKAGFPAVIVGRDLSRRPTQARRVRGDLGNAEGRRGVCALSGDAPG